TQLLTLARDTAHAAVGVRMASRSTELAGARGQVAVAGETLGVAGAADARGLLALAELPARRRAAVVGTAIGAWAAAQAGGAGRAGGGPAVAVVGVARAADALDIAVASGAVTARAFGVAGGLGAPVEGGAEESSPTGIDAPFQAAGF